MTQVTIAAFCASHAAASAVRTAKVEEETTGVVIAETAIAAILGDVIAETTIAVL
ncbi:hypothetical protein DPMN_117250 [Dreissena polymorpha]|uniref:Uncharacterized protein n=1 Tax=Dreissena polymorpha TaxID=45954 RepID=A0A9D4QVH3_DREPO|nr:hypothetical protein DPMN_117250 [Dreissena polymorpha]